MKPEFSYEQDRKDSECCHSWFCSQFHLQLHYQTAYEVGNSYTTCRVLFARNEFLVGKDGMGGVDHQYIVGGLGLSPQENC